MFKTLIDRSFCVTAITPNPGRSFLGCLASMLANLGGGGAAQMAIAADAPNLSSFPAAEAKPPRSRRPRRQAPLYGRTTR